MSRSRWSIGPWTVCVSNDHLIVKDGENNDLFDMGAISAIDQIDQGNARLVAAAPEMIALMRLITEKHAPVATIRRRAEALYTRIVEAEGN